jgi:O-antigen ligase
MVITMALALFLAVLAFGSVTIDFAAPVFGLAVILALFWAGKLFFARAVSWKHSPLHYAVAAFVLYAATRCFTSPLQHAARLELIQICLCAFFYFLAASNFYRSRDRNVLLIALMALAVVESLYGLWQFATRSDVVLHLQRPETYRGRASGTFVCPNHLAGFLEMVLAMLLTRVALWRSSKTSVQKSALQKVFVVYVALIALVGFLATSSRAGWVGLVLGMTTIVLWGEWNLRFVWPRLAVAAVTLAALGFFAFRIEPVRLHIVKTFAPASEKRQSTLQDPTIGGRTLMWMGTLQMIRDQPVFGSGAATWQWVHAKHRPKELQFHPEFAHNDILHLASDYGLVGLGLAAAVLICFYKHAAVFIRKSNTSDQRAFAAGAVMAVTCLLVHSWFDFNLHISANALLFSSLMGFTVGMEDTSERYPRTEMQRVPRYALGAFLVAVSVLAVWIVGPLALAEHRKFQGDGFKHRIQWEEALDAYARSIALTPGNPESHARMGEIYLTQSWWRRAPDKANERRELVQKAIEAFEKSLAANPWQAHVRLKLAMACEMAGKKDEALKAFERAIADDPNCAYLYQELGLFHRRTGDEARAAEAFEKSRSLFWDAVADLNLQDIKPK